MDNGLSQSHLAVSILLLLELVRYQYSVQRRRRIETRISYGSLCPTEAKLISSSSKVVCHSSALRTVHLCGCLTAVQLVFRASSIKMAAYTHVQTKKKRKCKSSVHQTKKKRKCKTAPSGSRTRVSSLEGSYPNRWTNGACHSLVEMGLNPRPSLSLSFSLSPSPVCVCLSASSAPRQQLVRYEGWKNVFEVSISDCLRHWSLKESRS